MEAKDYQELSFIFLQAVNDMSAPSDTRKIIRQLVQSGKLEKLTAKYSAGEVESSVFTIAQELIHDGSVR